MPNIISNTSCLSLLDNINALDILQKLYQNIYLTEEAAQEYGKPLEDWMHVVTKLSAHIKRQCRFGRSQHHPRWLCK